MIIYVSSYPRSGSSLIQQLINTFFERPWSEIDFTNRPLDKITGVPKYFANWRYDPEILTPRRYWWQSSWNKLNRYIFKQYDLEKWLALYDLKIPPHTKNCLYLLPGCKDVLTYKNRRILAKKEGIFFIKTHHLPLKKYLENEYVIQIVRHPGLVFLSYKDFIKNYSSNNKNISIDDVIEGKVTFGSWSYWHESWNQAMPGLKDRFLRLKFEDIVASEKSKVCEQIKELTGLNYNQANQELSFAKLKQLNSTYYRSGQSANWQKKYNQDQLDKIYELHGKTIDNLYY